ncbi:hypothetical protein B0H11DRAFT_1348920 [Mycena galericulata]|nr:hypothetical protein B0H11DRAFT_1348920 [Mycena galericulata]
MPHKRAKRSPVKALPLTTEPTASTSTSPWLATSNMTEAQPKSSKAQSGPSLFTADLRTLSLITPRVPPPPAWLRDVDQFFRRQAEVCTKADAATLDATVAAMRVYMARLEALVVQARAAQRTELEQTDVALLRWRVAATALQALDAYCWRCPSSRRAHAIYDSCERMASRS